MKEEWRDIEGYEGVYKISNLGNVKSIERYKKNHSKTQLVPERILSKTLNKQGYYYVTLYLNNSNRKITVHRLIASHFIQNPYNFKCVNHKNGIKTDNSISNLEWCTIEYNNKHAIENGLINNRGYKNGMSKLNTHQVKCIRNEKKQGVSVDHLSKKYEVSVSTIYNIVSFRNWKHII